MSGIGLTVSRDDISPALARMVGTAKNPLPVFRAMGTTFKSITEGNFNSVGAAYRPIAWKPKVGGGISNLQSRNPVLSKSFHLEVTNEHAKLSNPMPYAAIHQFGGKTAAHRIVPKRKKALAFGGKVYGAVNHPGSKIPARPFFPVDSSGRLIPKAEDLIRRAGERVMEKEIAR